MWMFYFLFWTAVRASAKEPIYGQLGGKAVLKPDSVGGPITNAVWKHGPDIAMEWYGGTPDSYRQFTDRGSLNTSTGAMTITGLTPGESGIYTAEINNRVNSKTELLVISAVPKPNISVSCDTEKTYCDFTCDGSTTGAAPVTYRWTAGEKRWPSTKELKITKEDKEEWFSCILENPVSSNSSEKVFNPFIEREGDRTWIYILVPVVAGIVVICIIIACFIYKCKKGKTDGYTFTGETVYKKGKDMEVIPLHFEESPDQDPLSVVTLSNSNGPENRPLLSSAQETSNQDPTSGVAHDTGNDVLHEADQETSNQDLLSVVTPGTSNGPVIPTVCEVHETPTEDQGAVVSPDTSNEPEKTVSLPAEEETSTQDTTSAATADINNDTEILASSPEDHETPIQDLEAGSAPDTSNEPEEPASLPAEEEISTQDTTSAASPETSNESERSASSPEDHETPNQDLEADSAPDILTQKTMSLPAVEETSTQDPTSTAPPDSSDETEKFASSPEVHETPNQDLEADSPDTSKEPEWSASSPEDPGTPTQDLKAAVAADTSNEPEKSPDYLDMRSTQYAGL